MFTGIKNEATESQDNSEEAAEIPQQNQENTKEIVYKYYP